MADWQTQTYRRRLHHLDHHVFLATSCLAPLPTLTRIDAALLAIPAFAAAHPDRWQP